MVPATAWTSSMMTVSIPRRASLAADVSSRKSDSGVVIRMSDGVRANALRSLLEVSPVRSVTVGTDAQGEAMVEAEYNGRRIKARAVSTDIVEASALAFLEVVNRVAMREVRERLKPTDHVPTEVVPVV